MNLNNLNFSYVVVVVVLSMRKTIFQFMNFLLISIFLTWWWR
jgi:hypothetical protein